MMSFLLFVMVYLVVHDACEVKTPEWSVKMDSVLSFDDTPVDDRGLLHGSANDPVFFARVESFSQIPWHVRNEKKRHDPPTILPIHSPDEVVVYRSYYEK